MQNDPKRRLGRVIEKGINVVELIRSRGKEEFWKEAEKILRDSFDEGDLVETERLQKLEREGYGDLLMILQSGSIAGMAYVCHYETVEYMLYLAVRKELRSRGIGRNVLTKLRENSFRPWMIDVESVMETEAEDYAVRVRRKDFYIRNGFCETHHILEDDGGFYEILTSDGKSFDKEFMDAMIKLDFVRYHPRIHTDLC